ncbi:unnamed protein product [Sphagnum troendelagicum]|uniref:Uncharacterized protein n=1 Tax=Sphagnum troendelagicum TaxID=128251 RepID=A0ABP0V0V2_9BRYO
MFYRSCVVNYCAPGTFTNEYNNIYILVLHSSNTKMVSICLHESYEYLEKVLFKSQANSKNTETPLSSNLQDKQFSEEQISASQATFSMLYWQEENDVSARSSQD